DRQAIDHVIFGEPAFAGNSDSKPQILQSLCAVSIWIDHAFNAFLFGDWPPPPMEIEPLWRGVEFDPRAGARCRVEHRRNIDLVRIAFQKQSPSRMRQHSDEWILQGANHPLRHVGFTQIKSGMNCTD